MKKTITKALAVLMITAAAQSTWAYDIITLPFQAAYENGEAFKATKKVFKSMYCSETPTEFLDFIAIPFNCFLFGSIAIVSDSNDQLSVSPEFNQFLNESGLSDEEISIVNNDITKFVNAYNAKDTNALQSMQFSPVTAGVLQIKQ